MKTRIFLLSAASSVLFFLSSCDAADSLAMREAESYQAWICCQFNNNFRNEAAGALAGCVFKHLAETTPLLHTDDEFNDAMTVLSHSLAGYIAFQYLCTDWELMLSLTDMDDYQKFLIEARKKFMAMLDGAAVSDTRSIFKYDLILRSGSEKYRIPLDYTQALLADGIGGDGTLASQHCKELIEAILRDDLPVLKENISSLLPFRDNIDEFAAIAAPVYLLERDYNYDNSEYDVYSVIYEIKVPILRGTSVKDYNALDSSRNTSYYVLCKLMIFKDRTSIQIENHGRSLSDVLL